MANETPLQRHYAELAIHAGLAWTRSIAIEDQKPFTVPRVAQFKEYAYYFDQVKRYQSYAKGWVATDFRRVLGALENFDAKINVHWLNYATHANQLVGLISRYVNDDIFPLIKRHDEVFAETTRAIQLCKEDVKGVMEACEYLKREMARIGFAGLATSFDNRLKPLNRSLETLSDKIPEEFRSIFQDIELLTGEIANYRKEMTTISTEIGVPGIWSAYYILAGVAIFGVTLTVPGVTGVFFLTRFFIPIAIAYFGTAYGRRWSLTKREQYRLTYIEDKSKANRKLIINKLKLIGDNPLLCSCLMLRAERDLYADMESELSNINTAASHLIRYYEGMLGKFEKSTEFKCAGQIGELINVFADNVKNVRPTTAQRMELVTALEKFKPNSKENIVGWSFDVVFHGMTSQKKRVDGRAKEATWKFNKYFVFQQITQFGPYQRVAPEIIDING